MNNVDKTLLRDALEHLRHLPWESETSVQKRGETLQGHRDRMSGVMERNNVRRDLIKAIEQQQAEQQQAEPVAWVGLSEEEILTLDCKWKLSEWPAESAVREAERILKEKNNG